MVSMEKTTKRRRKTTSMMLHHEERELERYRQSLETESKERLTMFRRNLDVFVGKYGHNLVPAWAPTVSHQLLNGKFSGVVHSFLPEVPNSRKVSLVTSSFSIPQKNTRQLQLRRTVSLTSQNGNVSSQDDDGRKLLNIDKFLKSSILSESFAFGRQSRSSSIISSKKKDMKLFKKVAIDVIRRQSVTRAFLSTLVEESEEDDTDNQIENCYLSETFRTLKDCRYLRIPTSDNKA